MKSRDSKYKTVTDSILLCCFLITDSTHIRIIAFSTAPINNCSIRIDVQEWKSCVKANDNLFVVKWNPHLYSSGVHNLEVNIVDDNGKQRLVKRRIIKKNLPKYF